MTVSRAKLKRELKKHGFILTIVGIQIINFIIFYVVVNFNSIIMAFQLRQADTSILWTLSNFKDMFAEFASSSSELLGALGNTLIFFVFGLVMLPISFTCSYFIYKKIFGHKFYRIIFFVPTILSGVVWSIIYKELLGPNGPITALFEMITGEQMVGTFFTDERYALGTVLLYGFWLGIAGNFVVYLGTMARIPESVIEAAKLDGVGWFRELYQIIVPLVWPTLATTVVISLTGIFTASGNILLLTGGTYGTNTISFFIFQRVYGNAETSNSYNYAAAVGLFFTILTLPIVLLCNKILSKIDNTEY